MDATIPGSDNSVNSEYTRLNIAINRASSALSAFSLLVTFAVMLLITIVCGTLAAKGRIPIGAFFVVPCATAAR